MKRPTRFYVYRFCDYDGNILYIGKGQGRRLQDQERRFGMRGEIVQRFCVERAAFNCEARLIQKHKPVHNKVAGGGGAVTRIKQPSYRVDPDMREMERIGTRLFVAKMLLRFDTRGYMTDQQRDRLKTVVFDLESNNQTAVANG